MLAIPGCRTQQQVDHEAAYGSSESCVHALSDSKMYGMLNIAM